jgi:molybdenum cofactor cytidylyltransferase
MTVPRRFAILPAAGASSRMGRCKLLLPWGRSTVIEALLAIWRQTPVEAVVMVTGAGDPHGLRPIGQRWGAHVVVPESSPTQMKDSVALALAHLRASFCPVPGDAWLLTPSDLPGLSADVVRAVLREQARYPGRILVPVHGGQRGHPVLFPWPLSDEVGSLRADQGVNALLRRHGVVEVEVDQAAILHDVDTPEQYRRWRPPP